MITYYLAVDIGASSGRHILGSLEDGVLTLEEIYRFENGFHREGDTLVWDVEALVSHVKEGLRVCRRLGKLPRSVAIDTWGVDYVLLDREGQEILPAVSYRDGRTAAAEEAVSAFLPQESLYAVTGIQKQPFNTVYQLYCDRQSGKLDRAAHLLMMPDYLSYKLTGQRRQEYTNATTTGLVNAEAKAWDTGLLEALGLPSSLFGPLSLPGGSVGPLLPAVREEVGFDCEVVLCGSHDTASAVAACPLDSGTVFLSSGTWSLIGVENTSPVLSQEALAANFTNEGGLEYRFRFLKNIMGMWLFQSIRRELGGDVTYDGMMEMAMASDFRETFDPADPSLLAPASMLTAIRACLGRPELPLADLLSSVYHSLAASYQRTVEEMEAICGKALHTLVIVGGGSRDRYLNRLTAAYTGRRVVTGLTEATATGNLLAQILRHRGLSLSEARSIVSHSFTIKETTV